MQRHVPYSFYLCTKDGYSNWIQTTTNFQMQEVFTYTIKLLLISPLENWAITAIMINSSRTRLLEILFKGRLKRRTASRRTFTMKLFFFATPGLTGNRFFLLFPGLVAYQLQPGTPSLSCSSTYCKSPTSSTSEMRTVVWGAVSPTADDATVSAPNQHSRVSLTDFLRDTFFSRHDFRFATTGPDSTPIAPQGSNLALFGTASAGSGSSVQHDDPSLGKKVSLREQRMTNRILHTCHCSVHFLMTDWNPIERLSKDGMQLRRTLHH